MGAGVEGGREVATDKRKKGGFGYVIGRKLGAGPKGGRAGLCRERRGQMLQPS